MLVTYNTEKRKRKESKKKEQNSETTNLVAFCSDKKTLCDQVKVKIISSNFILQFNSLKCLLLERNVSFVSNSSEMFVYCLWRFQSFHVWKLVFCLSTEKPISCIHFVWIDSELTTFQLSQFQWDIFGRCDLFIALNKITHKCYK